MDWLLGTLILGFKKHYMALNVDTEEEIPLFQLDKSSPALMVLDSETLVAKEGFFDFFRLFLSFEGF